MHQAFDPVAQDYDQSFSHTPLGRMLRARVWNITETCSKQTILGKALEINCGTGEDALWLMEQGYYVLATDVSAEMVAITQAKIERTDSAWKATARICSFAEIEQLPDADFDLIFSNFGGLNCVSPDELAKLGPVFNQKLKPGGKFVAVVMSRFCLWEILYFMWKGKPKAALRRFSRKPVEAQLDEQTKVLTWYYSPKEFKKHLQFGGNRPFFKPVGFWLAPSYLNPFLEKRPRLLRFLYFLEKKCSPSWLAFAGDHFWLCLEKKAN
jgi:SAM-dependent methyltransferase